MKVDKLVVAQDMQKWITHDYLNLKNLEKLKNNFKKNKPFPHLELRNFFNEKFIRQYPIRSKRKTSTIEI